MSGCPLGSGGAGSAKEASPLPLQEVRCLCTRFPRCMCLIINLTVPAACSTNTSIHPPPAAAGQPQRRCQRQRQAPNGPSPHSSAV